MVTVTKGQIVESALRKAVISSAESLFQAAPQETLDALQDLEAMVAQWKTTGFDIGYIFSDSAFPNGGEDSGLDLGFKMPLALCLARYMLVDNNRPVPAELARLANNAESDLRTAFYQTPTLKQRNDTPVGQGNNPYFARDRFYSDGSGK